MPSHEEVAENIILTQNHRNKISKLSIDTDYYTSKEANLEEMIIQLYNYYINLSGSIDKLSGSVDELSKLVKVGGVK